MGFGQTKQISPGILSVMVTADIGPFAKEGTRMHVTVSSIGNADLSMEHTPDTLGPDNKIAYSVAQGPVSVAECLPVLAVPMYKLITQPLVLLAMEASLKLKFS